MARETAWIYAANLFKKASFPSCRDNSGSVSPGFLHHVIALNVKGNLAEKVITDNKSKPVIRSTGAALVIWQYSHQRQHVFLWTYELICFTIFLLSGFLTH